MKALTISQPWASLIARGDKWVENRTWRTNHRGDLAIHAGARSRYLTAGELRKYPTGAIIAVGQIVGCVDLADARECHRLGSVSRDCEELGWTIEDVGRFLAHEYTEGPVCWILRDVAELAQPQLCTGHLGLWDAPAAECLDRPIEHQRALFT